MALRIMEQLLEKLLESVPKARILRIFMQNPEAVFTFQELVERSKVRPRAARKEITKLMKLGVVKKRTALIKREVLRKSRSRKRPSRILIKTKKARVYYVNSSFFALAELRGLIIKSSVASRKKLLEQLKRLGRVKLVVIAGIFIRNENSRTDLLIVGDKINKRRLDRFLAHIESEIGKQLRYTLMDSSEFRYRLDMYDRFLRDILEYPHEKLINKVKV